MNELKEFNFEVEVSASNVQVIYEQGAVSEETLKDNIQSNIKLHHINSTNLSSIAFEENAFDDSVNLLIVTSDGRWGFSLSDLKGGIPITDILRVSLTESQITIETVGGECITIEKELVEIMEQSIELDAPPGGVRPPELLKGVLEGTPIPVRETQGFFGHFNWDYSDVPKSVWDKYRPVFKERIQKLHEQGYIRYGSW